ncbi:MAG: hypothetical protein M3362_21245 [Acidobacteriota bacterium]|nr:hypothetical protein [Acidobacteriota bacterium]
MKDRLKSFVIHWGPGVVFLGTVTIYISAEHIKLDIPHLDIIQHLLLVLAAVMGVHLLEHSWLRHGMNRSNRNDLKDVLQESNDLIRSAAECGLKGIYPSRNDDFKEDFIQAVKKAKSRVWVLGIGLSEKVNLGEDLLPLLKGKSKRVDVKILLLDALRSPAVFRTFLESRADVIHKILNTDRSSPVDPPLEDPYFNQRLYHDFESVYKALSREPRFRAAVRFYSHAPSCWLAIIDNTAYFQPYTFGRSESTSRDNLTIGSSMPIFKFQSETRVKGFRILEDHFHKLWVTSDADLFIIGGRVADRSRLIRRIFKDREEWLTHVFRALQENKKSPGGDRRKYPRRPCESLPNNVTVTWGSPGNVQERSAEIVNFAFEGMLLRLQGPPVRGAIVRVKINPNSKIREAVYFKEEIVKPSNSMFKVMRVDEQPSQIAVQAHYG